MYDDGTMMTRDQLLFFSTLKKVYYWNMTGRRRCIDANTRKREIINSERREYVACKVIHNGRLWIAITITGR